jgi:ribose 5-phosphate isomerase
MVTVHIENNVVDFDSWKEAFDKFERFRRDHGVQRYRVSRVVGDENRVVIDLDFADLADAKAFRAGLEKIWSTPQSSRELVDHASAVLLDVVERRSWPETA